MSVIPLDATPTISIIIPVLNEEKLLKQTLECFPRAIREEFSCEIVLSDGGSTDATVQIAQIFGVERIVQHTSPHRQTIAEGRNAGAALARGEVLVFLNGDTVPSDVRSFFSAIHHWRLYESASCAIACPVQIAPAERRFSDVLFHGFFNRYIWLLNALGFGIGRGECQIIRRILFDKIGGYNPQIAAGEDMDLFSRLRHYGKISMNWHTLVYESPRRFRKFGYLKILGLWTLNALSVLTRNKAVSEEWEAIR